MSEEIRDIYRTEDGRFWMNVTPTELEVFLAKDPDKLRFIGNHWCTEVHIKRQPGTMCPTSEGEQNERE
jgi:hypothetical protein